MDTKVSDFKIAESIIRKLCKKYKATFIDVPVAFDDEVEGVLFVGKTKNIAHTNFKVVAKYIERSAEIVGIQLMPDASQRDNFLIVLATNLRTCMYDDDIVDRLIEKPYLMRLYQYPLVWILLKDIICPLYNKELINVKVLCAGSNQIDIAKYYRQEDIPDEDISDEPFIFVNKIDNRVIQNAFIFMEALKAYGLSPVEVIKDIYETDIYDKFQGLLEIALDDDDDIDDFKCAIMAILGINFYSLISNRIAEYDPKFIKIAQNSVSGLPNQFWFLGILEKMMEPARGADWSVYKNLEPYVKEFWDKVEEVKQKRIKSGHDKGVPFDVLLRIKSKQTVGYETDPTRTMQSLLSSDRVW